MSTDLCRHGRPPCEHGRCASHCDDCANDRSAWIDPPASRAGHLDAVLELAQTGVIDGDEAEALLPRGSWWQRWFGWLWRWL